LSREKSTIAKTWSFDIKPQVCTGVIGFEKIMVPLRLTGFMHIGYPNPTMTKKKLIETVKRIFNTDLDLSYLTKLTETELETLVACIRDRVDRAAK
jgi:hypothetical protein